MLLLCDADICCGPVLLAARRKGAQVLGRLDSRSWTMPWVRLHDGSYLVNISRDDRYQRGHALTARVTKYRFKHPHTRVLSAPIRLITRLLDPKQYPIEALIRLYHERWEIEQGLDEIKTHLCLSARTLRSQTPQGVEQELSGLLLAYFAVRTVMYVAADQADWDPDEASFVHTINVLPCARGCSQEVRQERVPARRLGLQARVVKRTRSRYPRKWYDHLHAPCLTELFLDLVVLRI